MSEKQAVYAISVTGDDEMVRAGDRISQRWSGIGDKVRDSVGGAVKSVAGAAASLAQDTIRIATAMGSINLAQLVNDSKMLNLQVQRYAIANKGNVAEIKQNADALSRSMLVPPDQIVKTAQAYTKLSYSSRTASQDIEALNELATEQGRELGDELPLGIMLRKTIGPAQSMRQELAKIGEQSAALNYTGGNAAFTDMLAGAAEALSHVSQESEQARTKVTAFLGALTKNAAPDQQKAIANTALQKIQADPETWSRTVGYDVLDKKTGKVKDPAQVLLDYSRKMKKTYGKEGALYVMRRAMGAETGTALANFDEGAFRKAMEPDSRVADSTAAKAQENLLNSEAGKRKQIELSKQNKAREAVGGPLADAQAAWNEMFEGSPKSELAASAGIGAVSSAALGRVAQWAGQGFLQKGGAEVLKRAPGMMSRVASGVGTLAETAGATEAAVTAGGLGSGTLLGLAATVPVAEYYGIKGINYLHDQQQADVNASLRHGQAAEGAARIAEAAKSGAYPDIYAATPDLMKYAKGAAGGTAQDQEAVLREMVALLANRNDLPSSFGNTVKQAFKDALRESAVQVVPENPSRKLTGKAEESGEGRS
jgi:hypothetical protein